MANNTNQSKPLTEKVVRKYEIVYDSPKIKGCGEVHVTSFGPNETHSLFFKNQTVGAFVNRIGEPESQGKTYFGEDILGKGNLLPGAFVLFLLKRTAQRKARAARRKMLGK
jgi:hypothetical protein